MFQNTLIKLYSHHSLITEMYRNGAEGHLHYSLASIPFAPLYIQASCDLFCPPVLSCTPHWPRFLTPIQGYQAIAPTSASLAQHRTQQHAHQHAVQATQQRAAQQRGSSTQKQMRPTKAVRKAAAGQYEADVASSLSQVE